MIEDFIVEEGDVGEVALRLQPDIALALAKHLLKSDDSGWHDIAKALEIRSYLIGVT